MSPIASGSPSVDSDALRSRRGCLNPSWSTDDPTGVSKVARELSALCCRPVVSHPCSVSLGALEVGLEVPVLRQSPDHARS